MSLNYGANGSHVDFSIGNAANVSNGAFSMLALWLMPSSGLNSGFTSVFNSGTERRAFGVDTAHLFGDSDFSSGFGTLTGAHWYWVGMSKPAGSAHYRFHFKDYTAGGSWTHGESVGSGNHTDPGTSNAIQVGSGSSFGSSSGDVAVAAMWTSELADLTFEAAGTALLADLMAQNPQWATRYMQSAPTSIQDLTGGGGNETGRTGTITASADPPAYDFSLTATAVATPRPPFPMKFVWQMMEIASRQRQGEVTSTAATVNVDGSLTVTANRTATEASVRGVSGSLTVTANRTATEAITHTVAGSLTVTANRTAIARPDHNVAGALVVTANRTATEAVTHTVAGSLLVTVNRTATEASVRGVSGALTVTVNRAATQAITHTVAGSLVVTANRTATVAIVHTVSGSLVVVVGLSASVTTPISGSRPVTVILVATADVSHGQYLFLPFFG